MSTTEVRERIYIAKACARAIVSACTARMDANRGVPEYDLARRIQNKYGEYLYDSLESTPPDELENIVVITPALIKRILDPNDKLENIL